MFAVDVCKLPATGGSTVVVVSGLFLLIAGVIVTRWVRQSSGRMSVVAAPLLLLGGLVLAPSLTDPCALPSTITEPSTTTLVPDSTTIVPSTTVVSTTTAAPTEDVFSNDNVLHAFTLRGSGFWTGDTTTSTVENGEPNETDSGAFSTVWFKWVATEAGQLVFDTCDTSFDSLISVYSIVDINDPWVIDPAAGYTYIAGDDIRGWARCALPDQIDPAATTVDVVLGMTYYLQLGGYSESDFGLARLNWKFTPRYIDTVISNDNVVNAYDLGTRDSGTWLGDNTSATYEPDQPYFDDGDSGSGDHSVWFKFVAWEDGQLVVDTCDTSFDAVLSAYTITAIGNPWNSDTWVTDDDASAGDCEVLDQENPALIRVDVTRGQTYYIQLDGYTTSNFGSAQLNWSLNALNNDDVVNAFELTGSGFWTGSTTLATVEVGEPGSDGDPYATVWFKWVATTTGLLVLDSCDTQFNSSLMARSISNIQDPWSGDVLIEEDGNSAECDAINSAQITVSVSAGSTYYIQLGGNQAGSSGPAQLNWTFTIPV